MLNTKIFSFLKHLFLWTFWFQEKRTSEPYIVEFVETKRVTVLQYFFLYWPVLPVVNLAYPPSYQWPLRIFWYVGVTLVNSWGCQKTVCSRLKKESCSLHWLVCFHDPCLVGVELFWTYLLEGSGESRYV